MDLKSQKNKGEESKEKLKSNTLHDNGRLPLELTMLYGERRVLFDASKEELENAVNRLFEDNKDELESREEKERERHRSDDGNAHTDITPVENGFESTVS